MTSLAIARVAPSDFGGDPSAQRLEGGIDLEDASYFMCLTACACLHGAFSIFFVPFFICAHLHFPCLWSAPPGALPRLCIGEVLSGVR